MPVVSDTSPLLNLAIIDRLDLLRAFYAPLAVPEAVVQELRNAESLLKNLREEADFWISDALWKDVLRRAGER